MARPRRPLISGHLEQLSTCFRWHVSLAGQRIRETIATTDRRAAEEYCIARYAELRQEARQRRGAPRGLLRVSDLIARFNADRLPQLAPGTQRTYRHSLERFHTFFVELGGDPLVADLGTRDVRDFLAWRRTHRGGRAKQSAAPISARALAKDRATLHTLLDLAVQLEERESNPVTRTETPRADAREPVILSTEEFDRLFASCRDPMLRLYVLALGETGGRCESEVLWLRWEDVDFAGQRMTIVSGRDGHRTKSGRTRVVPMAPRLAEAMREHFAACRLQTYSGERTHWVFHHTRTRRHYKAGQRIASMRRALATAAKTAELPAGFRPHDLRHRRATAWLAMGASITHVQKALGHADVRTTQIYEHLADQHVDALLGLERIGQNARANLTG